MSSNFRIQFLTSLSESSLAFSLVELLVSIAIVGILAALSVMNIDELRDHFYNAQATAAAHEYVRIIDGYMMQHEGTKYIDLMGVDPSTLDAGGLCTGTGGHTCLGSSDESTPTSCTWIGSTMPVNSGMIAKLETFAKLPRWPKHNPYTGACMLCNSHSPSVRLEWFLRGRNRNCVITNAYPNGKAPMSHHEAYNVRGYKAYSDGDFWGGGNTFCSIRFGT